MLITLPDDPIKRGKWIRTLIDSSHIEELIVDPKAEWINTIEAYVPVKFGAFPARMQLQGMADIDSLEDDPFKPVDLAAYFALSATGLAKFGTEKRSNGDLLGNLPYPFRLGMAQRSRTLGDFGEAAPENWRWSDADDQGKPTVDGVLMVYHEDEVLCSTALKIHKRLLEDAGGAIVHTIPTQPTPKSTLRPHEHFGFRDGISQPIIRGTEQFSRRAASRDIVAPGEFILGYKNNQGYVAPAITVPDESDIADKLPAENAAQSLRMPDFGDRSLSSSRDFGRNGSFLVIRQLMQDVEGFQSFTEQKVSELWDYDRLPEKRWGKLQNIIGQPITEEWVAAKLMGRWRDGRPLVGNPTQIDDTRGDNDGNDFAYGIDDPRGLQCPLGAHIRRTNPRDSLEPGDAEEQDITNRHRILRRGRSYQYDPDTQAYQPFDANRLKNPERGLMFMALCADIERQFEFVQQTWMGSPNFHGLSNEPDPVMSYVPDEAESKRKRVFTIPTTSGPVTLHNIGVKQGDEGGLSSFVLPKGGGYFFLPSRAALLYLAALET